MSTHTITGRRVALPDHHDGGPHGDPLRGRLGSPATRVVLGVRVDRPAGGEDVFFLVDELAEQVIGGSSQGRTFAFTHIIRHFGGLVRQLQTANTVLRTENDALHDEVQSLTADLDQACASRIGGRA